MKTASNKYDPNVEFIPKKQKKKKEKKKIVLEIDPEKIVKQTADTSDRLGMSSRQTAMILANVVTAGGGNLSDVPLSKSAVHRQKKKAREEKGQNLLDSFVHSDRGFVLHYDTKMVNPKGRDKEDRAAVLYSGGVHKEPYLLSIPRFRSSAGKDVEDGVLKVIENFDIDLGDSIGTVYHTTESNSLYKNGVHFR